MRHFRSQIDEEMHELLGSALTGISVSREESNPTGLDILCYLARLYGCLFRNCSQRKKMLLLFSQHPVLPQQIIDEIEYLLLGQPPTHNLKFLTP